MANTSTAEIMDRGINCLLEHLGVLETEHFISVIIREKFDYTKWKREYFDEVSADEFNSVAVNYAKAHPFHPRREQIPIE